MAMASSIPIRLSLLQLHSISSQPRICIGDRRDSIKTPAFRFDSRRLGWISPQLKVAFSTRASLDSVSVGDGASGVGGADWRGRGKVAAERAVGKLQGAIGALPPVVLTVKRNMGSNFALGFSLAVALLVIVVRQMVVGKPSQRHQGSVADLVKRGQLRSDRRGISKPLKYEDPFNNPLVKESKSNSTIEMCGKVYRLAPVTLTEEQQSTHQKRRSRAYKWKRPTIFLKEGDEIPPDVDPDTVRWIPANHPFATTVSDIDESLAQNNVYQKNGVPFRIRAEHEALQRKLEALQNEQKLDKVAINPNSFRDFEKPSNSSPKQNEQREQSSSVDEKYGQSPRSDRRSPSDNSAL